MTTPLYLVTGLHPESMAAATLGLQFDLPEAVVVRHELDAPGGVLQRTVSDLTGVLEREVVPLDHACTSCAVREDVIPTLERLGQLDRWQAIVVHLPVAADGLSVCRVLGWDRRAAPSVRVAGIVAAVDGTTVLSDLLEDDLVAERCPRSAAGDQRGVGEVLASMVEYADLVSVFGDTPPAGMDLLRQLARPGVPVGQDWPELSPAELLAGVHQHAATEAWVTEVPEGPSRQSESEHTWRLDLVSEVPLHPQRLHHHIEALGGGRFRTRGCFWLATRPDQIGAWMGAGGLLSIGVSGSWGRSRPFTRLLFTGTQADDVRADLVAAFTRSLLTDAELRTRGPRWETATDGLEPWLGPTTRVA